MYDRPYHTENLSGYSFLITGGAGFIGSNLVEYLVKYGAGTVRVLDNFSTGRRDNLDDVKKYPGFQLMEGDIRDPQTCTNACSGVDFVLHQAALGSVPRSIADPLLTNEVNVSGFLNVLNAARQERSVKKMVYAASSSTYGDSTELPKVEGRIGKPLSPYAVTKYVNELYGQVFSDLYGFHTVGLRYFNVFGPRQSPDGPYAAVIPLFMQAALGNSSPVINGDGEQTRDFTFVENAVQANIKGLLAGRALSRHEVFNIAVGENISLNRLWEILGTISDSKLTPEYRAARKGDVRNSLADIKKALLQLGYSPEVKVRDGLQFTYEWYKANTLIPNYVTN